jgi:predicted nucleotidyltransferase
MSGNFVQRGDPAICDKFSRTKMALLNGVDIVIELPVFFATASAEYFALAAVKLLNDLRCVDFLCFGSESGDMHLLSKTAEILSAEPAEFKSTLKTNLDKGLSYPASRGLALGTMGLSVTQPNDILGVEYLKALKKIDANITPITIKREGSQYHGLGISGNIASASAIRHAIRQNGGEDISSVMPSDAYDILLNEINNGKSNHADNFTDILRFILAAASAEELSDIADIGEGLENRILAAAANGGSLTEIAAAVKTKRYALTRINRALFRIILSIRQSELDYYASTGYSRYARVLGFRRGSTDLLSRICGSSVIPVITNVSKLKKTSNACTLDRPSLVMFEKEVQASNIYYAPLKSKIAVNELSTPAVII